MDFTSSRSQSLEVSQMYFILERQNKIGLGSSILNTIGRS
jgi:hypothetical protein